MLDMSISDIIQVWFGGDTGYCTIHMDIHTGTHPTVTNPKALPQDVCPAFKEIGERLGPFTLGLIPIGAYSPRLVMSPLHAAPVDSVRMFEDTVRMKYGQVRCIQLTQNDRNASKPLQSIGEHLG